MDKLDPVWFLKLSSLYLTSNNQVQSPRPECCKDIGLEVTYALCAQIKLSKLCQSIVSLHIDHNWIYYTEDWNAFYSILSEQIRSYESDLITNSMWHEPT